MNVSIEVGDLEGILEAKWQGLLHGQGAVYDVVFTNNYHNKNILLPQAMYTFNYLIFWF